MVSRIRFVAWRRGEWRAWFAFWAILLADLAYTFTFGVRDATVLSRRTTLAGIRPLPEVGSTSHTRSSAHCRCPA